MKLKVEFQAGIDDLVKMCIISPIYKRNGRHTKKTLFLSDVIKNSRAPFEVKTSQSSSDPGKGRHFE